MTKTQFPIQPYRNQGPRIVEFLSDCHAQDATVMTLPLEAWEGFVQLGPNRGGQDFAVIEDGGKVIALLMSHRRDVADDKGRYFRIIVHPAWRRQGIGSQLLDYVITQDRDETGIMLQCTCPDVWEAGRAFLEHHGFTRCHEELTMHRHGPAPAPEPALPALEPAFPAFDDDARAPGYVLSESTASADNAVLAHLHNQAYQGTYAFTPATEADIAATRALPGSRYLVARPGSPNAPIAGFIQVTIESDAGCIESLVVAPEHRRHGLGRALAAAGLRDLEQRGCTEVVLSVDADNTAAISLYQSVGFTRGARSVGFQRPRSQSPPSPKERP